ncbi:MAG: LuxR C-terminal-related transcriptional regulator [Lachnospiraceae bacterium]|nr:LuxR C-terminal-related transcriptional regulator [Lachnospiraceae bacterium]
MRYKPLEGGRLYIDKTEALEKGITVFPSIYIEGAAASGKTTAIRMLLEKHPEAEYAVFDMEAGMEAEMYQMLREAISEGKSIWIILDNIRNRLPADAIREIRSFLQNCHPDCRLILAGRERPQEELLELFWNGEMELLPQRVLLFTKEEIRDMAERMETSLNPDRIYKETGGWAGCVDLMFRLSQRDCGRKKKSREVDSVCTVPDPEQLRRSYEIDAYIRSSILDTLSSEEQEIMQRGAVCPWLDARLCEEIWNMPRAVDTLERLERKGLMQCEPGRKRWKMAPLFRRSYQSVQEKEAGKQEQGFWVYLGKWYESHGYVEEALQCLKYSGNKEAYRSCVCACYDRIPFSLIARQEVMDWKDDLPEVCYLRGMYCYFQKNQEGLDREIRRVEKELEAGNNALRIREIYLNLNYVKPDLPLGQWMDMLEKYGGKGESDKIRLYNMAGNSCTALCGLRDLSGLFACTKKEENRKARLWKEYLGHEEWQYYQLARIDYYLETERRDSIREEDWALLEEKGNFGTCRMQLVRMYLLCKLQKMQPEPEYMEQISRLQAQLVRAEDTVSARNAEAIGSIYAAELGEPEKMVRWLRCSADDAETEVTEENYIVRYCQARGCMLLNQYERASKILRRLIPYMQFYHRTRFLAEFLFQQAAADWEKDRHGKSLKSAIESFLVNGNCRYVRFYTGYGKRGEEVLKAYVEWMENNTPGGWHRKKKYNYGNVLRMPLEDYLEVILRCARREARFGRIPSEESSHERLTMMETIILQDISHGLSNADIGREQNLKITTVKSHIYSLYKKLGVNSRVQAVLKGKEMGLLK